jgi:hypothetical protein
MPTTEMRTAHLDATIPAPTPKANGHVTVADIPVIDRPRAPDKAALSPARKALGDHLKAVEELESLEQYNFIPGRHLEYKLKDALAALQQAEAAQATAEVAHAAAITEALSKGAEVPPPATPDPEIQTKIAQARSSCNSYRLALEEHRTKQAQRSDDVQKAKARDKQIFLEIVTELHHTHLERWAEARDAFHTREAELCGLHELIGIIGRRQYDISGDTSYLRRLDTMRPPWRAVAGHVELSDKLITACADRWAEVLHRLQQGDLGATL